MEKYTHLLFDIDHTLWDFNTNCRLTLQDLFTEHKLADFNINFEDFYQNYLIINNEVWTLYDQNLITKEEIRTYRFQKLLSEFNIKNSALALDLESKYLDRCPKMGNMIPFTKELLDNISSRYTLCLITNGFQETQALKVQHSILKDYFDIMFTSESVKFKKPDVRYFNHVLQTLTVSKENCLVIGDNPHTDIQGAKNSGIDTAWVNTQNYPKTTSCTYYFKDLEALSVIL